jgi:hypothetical protein
MIRWAVLAASVVAGVAFSAGLYVGWRTTLRICDNVERRMEKKR